MAALGVAIGIAALALTLGLFFFNIWMQTRRQIRHTLPFVVGGLFTLKHSPMVVLPAERLRMAPEEEFKEIVAEAAGQAEMLSGLMTVTNSFPYKEDVDSIAARIPRIPDFDLIGKQCNQELRVDIDRTLELLKVRLQGRKGR